MRQVSCIEFAEKYTMKNIRPIIFLASIHIAAGIGRQAIKRHHGGLIIIGDEKHVKKRAWELDANNPLKVHYGKKITETRCCHRHRH